jgi:hypothetical protein
MSAQPITPDRALELAARWDRLAEDWRAAGELRREGGRTDWALECEAAASAYAHCALVLRTEIEG